MSDPDGYLKPNEVHKIIEKTKNVRDRLLILLLWNTGRRISELVDKKYGMRKKDIDFLHNKINFTTLKTKGKKRTWVKGIDPLIIKGLEKLCAKKKDDDRVFNISRQRAYDIFLHSCHATGLRMIGSRPPHPHHLRHSAIMFMYAKGMKPEEIQQRTNHVDLNSLLWYIHLMTDDVAEKFIEAWKEEHEWVKNILQ